MTASPLFGVNTDRARSSDRVGLGDEEQQSLRFHQHVNKDIIFALCRIETAEHKAKIKVAKQQLATWLVWIPSFEARNLPPCHNTATEK